jgi:Ca2+-binding RTX toxin-like protein
LTAEGQITWSDGETGIINAYDFWNTNRITADPEGTEIPEEIQELPNLYGRGTLNSLPLSMTLDETGALKSLVENFCEETNPDTRLVILDQILLWWAGASDIAANSRGGFFDARKLAFLEQYRGKDFVGSDGGSNPVAAAALLLEDSYNYAKQAILGELLAVSIYKDAITDSLVVDQEAETVSLNILGFLSDVQTVWEQDNSLGLWQMQWQMQEFMTAIEACKLRDLLSFADLQTTYETLAADNADFAEDFRAAVTVNLSETGKTYSLELWGYGGNDTIAGGNADDYITGGDGADNLYGGTGNDLIFGDQGADHIEGGTGDDILFGGAENDTLKAGDGNDIIIGGTGNDYLQGDGGNDVYVWNPGDGYDTINDYTVSKFSYNQTGVLKLGEGVDPANVELTRVGNDAVFIVGETGERVAVQNWYSNGDAQLSQVEFADGTVWTRAQINAMSPVIRGTSGDDTITGTSSNDTIYAGAGNDAITAGDGNDTIIAGAGNDSIEGGYGSDVYVWNLGDGNDTINDYTVSKFSYNQTGVLKLGEGVDPANVELTRAGNDAVFIIGETGERVAVQNWYSNGDAQLSQVEFADGTVWTRAQINAMSPVIRGTDGDDSLTGYAGQNNILIGGTGNDLLTGNNGHDIYVWTLGDGNDTIDDYSYNKRYGNDTGVLSVGAEVDPTLIELTRNTDNLVCEFTQTGELVTFQNWYSADYYQLTSINFANGTTWTRANINAIASGTLSPFSTNP